MNRMNRSYCLGLYEKALPVSMDWEEKLTVAKQAGFDFIEMSIDETDAKLSRLDMSLSDCRRLADLMYGIGMPIGSICLSGHRRFPLGSNDPVIERKSLQIMEKAITLASRIGVRLIQLAGYDVYYEEESEVTKSRFVENIGKSVDIASAYGISLGFETMETPFMNTVAKAMGYVDLIGSPWLGVYPDLGNITNAGVDVEEDIRKAKGHIFAMHLKETRPGVFREIPYGKGHVDFMSGIEVAWKVGVRRFVAEFWNSPDSDWESDLEHAVCFLRPYIDRCCVLCD